MSILPFFVLFVIISACNASESRSGDAKVHSDSSGITVKDTVKKYGDMKQYWLVFLLAGKNRTHDSMRAARIQEAHLANIDRLANDGIIIMAGPMGYKPAKDLRGIFIMDAKDSATAASYIQTDSAIITGRLRFDIHPWWTAKGNYQFK